MVKRHWKEKRKNEQFDFSNMKLKKTEKKQVKERDYMDDYRELLKQLRKRLSDLQRR